MKPTYSLLLVLPLSTACTAQIESDDGDLLESYEMDLAPGLRGVADMFAEAIHTRIYRDDELLGEQVHAALPRSEPSPAELTAYARNLLLGDFVALAPAAYRSCGFEAGQLVHAIDQATECIASTPPLQNIADRCAFEFATQNYWFDVYIGCLNEPEDY